MLKMCPGPQMPRISMLVREWKKNPSSTPKYKDALTILEFQVITHGMFGEYSEEVSLIDPLSIAVQCKMLD